MFITIDQFGIPFFVYLFGNAFLSFYESFINFGNVHTFDFCGQDINNEISWCKENHKFSIEYDVTIRET